MTYHNMDKFIIQSNPKSVWVLETEALFTIHNVQSQEISNKVQKISIFWTCFPIEYQSESELIFSWLNLQSYSCQSN